MSDVQTEPKEVEDPDGETVLAYSTREMAVMFAVSVDTVRRWMEEGKFPYFKGTNGRLYVRRNDALEWANKKWGDG